MRKRHARWHIFCVLDSGYTRFNQNLDNILIIVIILFVENTVVI